MVEELLAPINRGLFAMMQRQDWAFSQEIIGTLSSIHAFPLAHELGHQLMFLRGESLYQKIADTISHSQNPYLAPLYSMCRGVVICSTMVVGYEMILDQLLTSGMFLPNTRNAVQNHYHNTEIDADILGMYMAMRAGFDPHHAVATFLADVPESLTHPAEADTIAFLNQMASDAAQVWSDYFQPINGN